MHREKREHALSFFLCPAYSEIGVCKLQLATLIFTFHPKPLPLAKEGLVANRRFAIFDEEVCDLLFGVSNLMHREKREHALSFFLPCLLRNRPYFEGGKG